MGPNNTVKTPAPHWGVSPTQGLSCDIPSRTADNAFAWIMKHDKVTLGLSFVFDQFLQPDFVIWTGDINSHNVWEYTRKGNTAAIANLAALFEKHFKGVPIFSAVGNHEEVPCNECVKVILTHERKRNIQLSRAQRTRAVLAPVVVRHSG